MVYRSLKPALRAFPGFARAPLIAGADLAENLRHQKARKADVEPHGRIGRVRSRQVDDFYDVGTGNPNQTSRIKI